MALFCKETDLCLKNQFTVKGSIINISLHWNHATFGTFDFFVVETLRFRSKDQGPDVLRVDQKHLIFCLSIQRPRICTIWKR